MKRQNSHGFISKISLIGLFSLLGVFVLAYLASQGEYFSYLHQQLALFYNLIKHHAGLLLFSLLFLPTFGIPLSPMLVCTGALWPIKSACVISFCCIGFNLVFSYFFYKKCLNRFLFSLIFRHAKLPEIPTDRRLTSLRWCFLIQLIPHIPYSIQCYILATLKDVHFWHYLSISWLMQSLWAIGFICSGQAILSGQLGWAVFSALILGIYLTYRYGSRFRKTNSTVC